MSVVKGSVIRGLGRGRGGGRDPRGEGYTYSLKHLEMCVGVLSFHLVKGGGWRHYLPPSWMSLVHGADSDKQAQELSARGAS